MKTAALRAVALAIAIAGVLDPSIALERRSRPMIALHTAPGAEDLGTAVTLALQERFTVVPAPVTGASADVIAGNMPPPSGEIPGLVVRDSATPVVAVSAPSRASLYARVPVQVGVRPGEDDAAAGLELYVDGLLVERREISSLEPREDGSLEATLSFAPSATGPRHLRVRVGEVWADTLVNIDDRPWHVAVYDARPSWSSTFVRRALELDARFAVAARIDTAPGSSVASGSPPGLGDLEALEDTDLIVVGAPDALQPATVDRLTRFIRRRGGSVVVLLDSAPEALAQLAKVQGWDERLSPVPAPLMADGGERWLQASELVVPAVLPAGARVLVGIEGAAGVDPVVWQLPLGAGRLVVSGALDAWRFRAVEAARFDEFWRRVAAEAAAAAPAPLELRAEPRVGRPGEIVSLEAVLRDVALDDAIDAEVGIDARLEGGADPLAVRLWPGAPGRFSGRLRMPERAGNYRVVVEAEGVRAVADLLVREDAAPAASARPALLEAWAAARGGAVIPASRLDDLGAALDASIAPQLVAENVRVMRSGWWMLPFALALGGEWWLRRRRGER